MINGYTMRKWTKDPDWLFNNQAAEHNREILNAPAPVLPNTSTASTTTGAGAADQGRKSLESDCSDHTL